MFGDEVVEDHRDTFVIAEPAAAIEEDHEGRGLCGVILGGRVDRVVVRRAGIELAGIEREFRYGSFRNSGLRLRIGAERVLFGWQQRGGAEYSQSEGFHRTFGASIPEIRRRSGEFGCVGCLNVFGILDER